MKNVLVLGAGMVARPLVRYLLEKPEISLTIASRTVSKAEKLIGNHPKGKAYALNVQDAKALKSFIQKSDLVISLLPWVHHMKVANLCLELKKHLVTTSYVKPEMQALHEKAKANGLVFLNEIGVDPGIDHMAAMRVINGVREKGGKVVSFFSYCGGLPALSANTNPLGYKFSWSPSGVMLAANNDGRYLKNGKTIEVAGKKLFEHYWLLDVPGAGTYEAYINRDALPYIDLYGLQGIKSMYRGTLRNVGHCESWNYFKQIGLLDQNKNYDFDKITLVDVMADLTNSKPENIEAGIAAFLKVPEHSITIKKLKWMGLLDKTKLNIGNVSVFDMFAHILQEKLTFAEEEVDLLLQHHEFTAEYPDGKKEFITSTMVDEGIPGGDSSMARTVSLPAAIATYLILTGKITKPGVSIPVVPEIYNPVLDELKTMDIQLKEIVKQI